MRRIEVVKVECLSTYLCWILRLLFGQSALVDCCCSADSGRLEATGKVGSSNQPFREDVDARRFVVTVQRIRGT